MYRAQEYADKCVYGHSDSKFRQNIGGFAQLGENLYAQTNKLDLFVALEAWYNEINDYNYQTRACNAVCGHYTQNVWFSSYALGCGIKFCKPLNQPCGSNACLLWEYGYYVVCHYGPGGNVRGHHPFRKGKACSQCETDAVYCICGLCSKRPQIGSDSANSTMQANIIAAAAVAIFISVLF
ncbi:hypothetical protein RRG08_046726 [Elysia crispata]|uniref:SCP domain-containing protein n=1 Tax=Elysia crispata TaxID=231223 RepID=A0AAE0ZV11_9GAST|nr:hypothetical protein RRG08_046726 [Elysia crispata]